MSEYIVTADPYLRVRNSPDLNAPIVGGVVKGQHIDVSAIVNGWARVALTAGGAPMINTQYLAAIGYMSASYLQPSVVPPLPPPVPTSPKPLIGVNVIFDGDAARYAISLGCKFISVTFNPDLAWLLKQQHPDLTVAARGNFYKGHLPALYEVRDKLGPAIKPGVICYGVNENDQIGDDPESIRKRAEFDRWMWQLCQDAGAKYAGAGFAMGGPNIVEPAVRDAMRKYYAPLVNSGMWFNQHTYSGNDHSGIPIKERIYRTDPFTYTWDGITFTGRQTWWLEERERFYRQVCGFGSQATFISDETGVDAPGPFSDFGYTDEEIAAWCKRYQQIKSEPMPDGSAFHFIGGALFQVGDKAGQWRAFELSLRLPALQAEVWA